jgi:hypothetical protein
MVAPLTKLDPFAVSVKLGPPAAVDVGLTEVKVGTGLLPTVIVNVRPLEVPPPGVGFVTVIIDVPEEAIFAAGTVACSEDDET